MKSTIFVALATLAMAATGCGHGSDLHSEHEHEHEHEEHLLLTAYSADFELFAEATPLVAGEECEVLAHLTQLPGFRPLEQGAVTATLTVGADRVSEQLDAPTRPGIYKFSLTPAAAGEASLQFSIATAAGESHISIDGLTVYADEHEAHHAAAEAEAKSSNAVAFTKEMSWKVDFATEPVELRHMGQVIHTMGQVQPSQGDVRGVTAKASGVLTYAVPHLTDGKTVSAGQPLFRIDAAGLADNNLSVRYTEAKNNFDTARREYERKVALRADRLITESELLAAKNAYDNAKAVYDNLSTGFADGGSTVAAPISGYLTGLTATNGQYVEAGQLLATVAQNRDLFIKAEVQPGYFPHLGAISGANIRRLNGGETRSLAEMGGSVVSYGKAVDTDHPLIPVVFRVNQVADMLPGSFVEMFITTAADAAPVATVPVEALIEEMGSYFVYVQLTPEYFEKREVKIGCTDGRATEILSGVKPGERVVSRGAVMVKLAHASGTLDAHSGHVH